MISDDSHALVAVDKNKLITLVNLAIQKGISIEIVDTSNYDEARQIVDTIEYQASNEEWSGSSC